MKRTSDIGFAAAKLDHEWMVPLAAESVNAGSARQRIPRSLVSQLGRNALAAVLKIIPQKTHKKLAKVGFRYWARTLPTPKTLPTSSDVKQVLFFADMGIGNFIMVTPLLRAIREQFCQAEVVAVFLKGRGADYLAKRIDSVDRCIMLTGAKPPGKGTALDIVRQLRAHGVRRPDLLIGRFNGSSYIPLAACSLRVPWRVGHTSSAGYVAFCDSVFNLPVPMRPDQHEVERNLDLARCLGITVQEVKLEFPITPSERVEAAEITCLRHLEFDKLVCLQMGSSELQYWKRWPAEHWQELIRLLADDGLQLALIGSPDEHALTAKIAAASGRPDRVVNLCGEISLGATAEILRHSRLLVCNDSGLMHVAAAVGTPIIGIFGPTEYDRTRPYSDNFVALRGKCKCNAQTLFDRATSDRIGRCDRPCLSSTTPGSVAAQVLRALGLTQQCKANFNE